MEQLISPLYSKSRGPLKGVYFQYGVPGNINDTSPKVMDYYRFWYEILRASYLGHPSLRTAIRVYLDAKSSQRERERPLDYESVEAALIDLVEKRYEELSRQLYGKNSPKNPEYTR